MEECIFCKIVKGEIPSSKVYEDSHTLAFLDILPINKGHVLVIPKKHYAGIHEMPVEEMKWIGVAVKMVADAVKKATGAHGINVLQANGAAAGQEVMHFHVHVIPRFEGDGSGFKCPKKEYAGEEMRDFAEKIRKNT